jgi:hypothetical protein
MNPEMDVGTNRKALQINLDAKMYGTFAEIGAGRKWCAGFSVWAARPVPSRKRCPLTM